MVCIVHHRIDTIEVYHSYCCRAYTRSYGVLNPHTTQRKATLPNRQTCGDLEADKANLTNVPLRHLDSAAPWQHRRSLWREVGWNLILSISYPAEHWHRTPPHTAPTCSTNDGVLSEPVAGINLNQNTRAARKKIARSSFLPV